MDEQQAKTLGSLLRQKREALGLSLRQLAKLAEVNDVNIFRLERGDWAAPAPDKLARIAEALGLSLADVYALADYAVPTDLPSFKPYLRTKYRSLPQEEVDKIEAYAQKLAKKHGVNLKGPAPGEDE
jgi:transcriptional regulator with XRE-family HTH domain